MKNVFFLLLFLGLSQLAAAQTPVSTGPTPTPAAGPTAVPIDGGASLLLASGVAYGLRRLRRRQQSC
ncbi:hypothetical protein A0257_07775 [Hymenobacter psoromatis]|nr:hypothetical protein A0257_07775 [Hymenobacter psoromatis]